ncbi:PLAC8 family protein [Colletotrichum tofieldiae]|nr:PLAC8 family protein [Colletotrichum tofieldiae]GKT74958.1 PLAC8 family protein [Colletotrichum tofieldiae]GKT92174.1 PLAC8 family protein [Colletotrichum tofieldiae]
MVGTCLPCLLLGKTSERLRDPTMQTYEAINTDCMLMCGISFFTGCGWVYGMMKRGEIRERFGIKGSGASDCCVSYWCSCCALIQQDKEVQARMSTGPIVQGYQPQKEGMHMPQHN